MSKLLVIFGNKSTGEEAYVLAKRQATEFDAIEAVFFDDTFKDEFVTEWKSKYSEVYYLISMANLDLRYRCQEFAEAQRMIPYTLIHPSAVIEPSAIIGHGCYICQYSVVSINAHIGDHCIIHMHVTVGHEASIGSHTVVLPGARIGGKVQLDSEVLIGSNAFIYQGKKVGKGSQVDAMTYVDKSLPAGVIKSVRSKYLIDRNTMKALM